MRSEFGCPAPRTVELVCNVNRHRFYYTSNRVVLLYVALRSELELVSEYQRTLVDLTRI